MIKKNIILLCCIILTFFLSGCNTVAGVGKDLQGGGKSLENSAKKTHREINSNN